MNKVFLFVLISISNVLAAYVCVRSSATGTGTGADWTNARTTMPTTITRGDTVFVADGTYPRHTFDDAESGATKIYVRHANPAECRNIAGWNDTMGDRQAVFTINSNTSGILEFTKGYYEIDGITGGGPNNWKIGHGIKIDGGKYAFYGVNIGSLGNPVGNLAFAHIEISGNRDTALDQRGLNQAYGGDSVYVGYCWIHNLHKSIISFAHSDSITAEYNFFGPNGNSNADLMNVIHGSGFGIRNLTNVTIRYNFFEDISETGYICLVNDTSGEVLSNIDIIGNIFNETKKIAGAGNTHTIYFGRPNTTLSNINIINNTFSNRYVVGGGNSGVGYGDPPPIDGGGNSFSNNIWFACTTNTIGVPSGWTHLYNYYTKNSWTIPTEATRQTGTSDPFVNVAYRDFRLTVPTNPCTTLSAPHNVDMFGTTRGVDANWDRGAIEYGGLDAKIYCSDSTPEAGQEVYFDAFNSVFRSTDTLKDTINWSFGDGHALKIRWPVSIGGYTGPAAVHYYMDTGSFICTLIVKDINGISDTATTPIHVHGIQPLAGLEIVRPNFTARRSMYITVKCSTNVTSVSSNTMSVYLTKYDGYIDTLVNNRSNLASSETFLLTLDTIHSGVYYLTYLFRDDDGDTIGRYRESFKKSYDGKSKFGIDKNNSLYDGDSLFFPVTPWILGKNIFNMWDTGAYINTGYGFGSSGYTGGANPSNWGSYTDTVKSRGWKIYGPGGFEWNLPATTWEKNSPLRFIDWCIDSSMVNGRDTVISGYGLSDEPNTGGRNDVVPSVVLAAQVYRIKQMDDKKPTIQNLYGFPFLTYYGSNGSTWDGYYYTYDSSAVWFGKKTCYVDITGMDMYPFEYSTHAAYNGRRVIKEWVDGLDRFQRLNNNLTPHMVFVEVCDLHGTGAPSPTPYQIRMMTWLAITHGAKGINWFPYHTAVPAENYSEMKRTNADIQNFKNIILGEPVTGLTDNSNDNSNRVETMYRCSVSGSDTTFYVFAVRLTEPDSSAYFIQSNEPATITTTFSLPFSSSIVTVEGESRSLLGGSSFSDEFDKNEVHFYSFTKNTGAAIRRKMVVKFN